VFFSYLLCLINQSKSKLFLVVLVLYLLVTIYGVDISHARAPFE